MAEAAKIIFKKGDAPTDTPSAGTHYLWVGNDGQIYVKNETGIVNKVVDGNISDISTADWVLDEDDMVSNSDEKIPTQQSVKAYVDSTAVSNPNDITYNTDNDVSGNNWVIDEDNMASNLDTKVPTQQSVKIYVDNNVAPNQSDITYNTDNSVLGNNWVLDEDNMSSNSDTKLATQQSIKAYVDAHAGGVTPFIHIQDIKPHGQNGGTFTRYAKRTRVLNTVLTNTISGASLSNNRVTLPPGEYYCQAIGLVYRVSYNRMFLEDLTHGVTLLEGLTHESATSSNDEAYLSGRFTISSAASIELQHYCTSTKNNTGFGRTNSKLIGNERYADLKFWKVG